MDSLAVGFTADPKGFAEIPSQRFCVRRTAAPSANMRPFAVTWIGDVPNRDELAKRVSSIPRALLLLGDLLRLM